MLNRKNWTNVPKDQWEYLLEKATEFSENKWSGFLKHCTSIECYPLSVYADSGYNASLKSDEDPIKGLALYRIALLDDEKSNKDKQLKDPSLYRYFLLGKTTPKPDNENESGAKGKANKHAYIAFSLDGTSPPIHRANATVPFSLRDETAAAEYLRFFCQFVQGEEGSFYLIEDSEELEEDKPYDDVDKKEKQDEPLTDSPEQSVEDSEPEQSDADTTKPSSVVDEENTDNPEDDQVAADNKDNSDAQEDQNHPTIVDWIDEVRVIHEDPPKDEESQETDTKTIADFIQFKASVSYGSHAFIARFRVLPSGMVEMLDDDPAGRTAVVKRELVMEFPRLPAKDRSGSVTKIIKSVFKSVPSKTLPTLKSKNASEPRDRVILDIDQFRQLIEVAQTIKGCKIVEPNSPHALSKSEFDQLLAKAYADAEHSQRADPIKVHESDNEDSQTESTEDRQDPEFFHVLRRDPSSQSPSSPDSATHITDCFFECMANLSGLKLDNGLSFRLCGFKEGISLRDSNIGTLISFESCASLGAANLNFITAHRVFVFLSIFDTFLLNNCDVDRQILFSDSFCNAHFSATSANIGELQINNSVFSVHNTNEEDLDHSSIAAIYSIPQNWIDTDQIQYTDFMPKLYTIYYSIRKVNEDFRWTSDSAKQNVVDDQRNLLKNEVEKRVKESESGEDQLALDLSGSIIEKVCSFNRVIVDGTTRLGRIHGKELFVGSSIFCGKFDLFWSKFNAVRFTGEIKSFENQPNMEESTETDTTMKRTIPCEIWGVLNCGSSILGDFIADGLVVHGPIWIYGSNSIGSFKWSKQASKKFSGDGVPKQPFLDERTNWSTDSQIDQPAFAFGGLTLSDTRVATHFVMRGVDCPLRHPLRVDLLHERSPYQKLKGCIRIEDCEIGFDLAIAGMITSHMRNREDRTDENGVAHVEHEVLISGTTIGGDLDFRGFGLVTHMIMLDSPQPEALTRRNGSIRIENIEINGNLRCSLVDLRDELHQIQMKQPNNVSKHDKAYLKERKQLQEQSGMIAKNLPKTASTFCRSFSMRGVNVRGDARLDALRTDYYNPPSGPISAQNVSVVHDGAVDISMCTIQGDLALVVPHRFRNDNHNYNSNIHSDSNAFVSTKDIDEYTGRALIGSRLNLTGTECDHFLLSGWCFGDRKQRTRLRWNDLRNDLELTKDGIILRRFSSQHFELIEDPIGRDLDLRGISVQWWDFPTSDQKSREDKVKVFNTLLEHDMSRTRSTYIGIERSFLAQGDIETAEKIRKKMCYHILQSKIARHFTHKQSSFPASAAHLSTTKMTFQLLQTVLHYPAKALKVKFWLSALGWTLARVFGYGMPTFLLLILSLGITVSYVALRPDNALEPSLAYLETRASDTPCIEPIHTINDKIFIAVRHLFPMLPLETAEDWRASYQIVTYKDTIPFIPYRRRPSDTMGAISIAAWFWWALFLLTVSLKAFRFLGAHDVK